MTLGRFIADFTLQAKTAWVKSPGIEVDWDMPLELTAGSGATHLKVPLNAQFCQPERTLARR